MAQWIAKGTYFESCNCDVACPCVFLSRPTEGECTVLIGWHVEQGSDGIVGFDGLNLALAVHAPGHMLHTKWKAAIYVDDRAGEAQRQTLVKIFGGRAGGVPGVLASFIGDVLGIRSVPIVYEADGGRRRLTIPGIAAMEIEQLAGQDGGGVTVSGHPLAVSPGFPATVAKSKRLDYTDHGLTWSLSEKNGFFAPFAYHGD